MFTSSTHSPCNKTEQCQIKRNSNFHSTEEVKAIKDLIPCLESRREKDNLEPKLRKNWAIQFVDPECSWKLYQEWVNNKTRIVHKAGLGTYGSSHSKLEAHRKEYVKKRRRKKKSLGAKTDRNSTSAVLLSESQLLRKTETERGPMLNTPPQSPQSGLTPEE